MKVSSSPGSDSDDSDPSRGAENPFQVGKRSFWGLETYSAIAQACGAHWKIRVND